MEKRERVKRERKRESSVEEDKDERAGKEGNIEEGINAGREK